MNDSNLLSDLDDPLPYNDDNHMLSSLRSGTAGLRHQHLLLKELRDEDEQNNN